MPAHSGKGIYMSQGAQLILAARERQLKPNAALSIRDKLADLGAGIAEVLDLMQQPAANEAQSSGDLFKPRLVFIGSDGKVTDDTDSAVAVVFPQYRRMFALEVKTADNWDHANEVAAKCKVLALADWYLPSVKELELLICRDRISPATYPALIKHTPFHEWYWVRDPHPLFSSFAFSVEMNDGRVEWHPRKNNGLVRACREVSASELSDFGL